MTSSTKTLITGGTYTLSGKTVTWASNTMASWSINMPITGMSTTTFKVLTGGLSRRGLNARCRSCGRWAKAVDNMRTVDCVRCLGHSPRW